MNKKVYEEPSTEALGVRFEGVICTSGEYHQGGGGSYGDNDTNDNGDY